MSKKRGKQKKSYKHEIETVELDAAFEEAETTCCICNAEFLDPEDLQQHISQVHVNLYIKELCGFCTSSFNSLVDLTIHIRDKHLTSLSICTYCYRTFIDAHELLIHQKLHKNNSAQKPYSCSNCKESFIYKKDLERHEIQNHYDIGPGVFLHKYFSLLSSYLNLNVIAFLESLGSETVYICGKCNYTNHNAKSYIAHLKKSACNSYACDKCYKVWSTRKYLIRHMERYKECRHSPNEEDLNINCNKCNIYIRKEIYAEHYKSCTVTKCQICQITFASLERFTVHRMENHQNSINVTSCKYCRKQYVGQAALQKHIQRMHGKELHLYKYTCSDCNYSFKHPKHLFSHFHSTHPDMKPFTCKICEKSFKQRKKFSIHIKVSHNSQGTVKIADDSHVYFTEKSGDANNSTVDLCEDNCEEAVADEEVIELNKVEEAVEEVTDVSSVNEAVTPAKESKTIDKPVGASVKARPKRKQINRSDSIDSDDEPLTKKLKRKVPNWNKSFGRKLKNHQASQDRKDFTCPKCKKYCYTFQNYKQHLSLHSKNISLTCIKCDAIFKSETELKMHVSESHSHSQLTETLKNVLEKRNKSQNNSIPVSEDVKQDKFRNTMKKVNFIKSAESAVLTEVKTGLSKFLESFTPEIPKQNTDIKISANVSIKTVHNAPKRPSIIKMHKFVPPQQSKGVMPFKLAMPIKCKFPSASNYPQATITVASSDDVSKFSSKLKSNQQKHTDLKSPDEAIPQESDLVHDDHAYAHDTHYDYAYEVDEEQTPAIPEVAEEVMLASESATETTLNTSKPIYTHKLILPNIPECFSKVRIGHLLPEAPFYKIVNVGDFINKPAKKAEVQEEPVTLPSGTKLVNVNPLEHLLKDVTVVPNAKSKSKIKDYSSAVAKAILKLQSKTFATQPVKKPKKVIEKKPKKLNEKSLRMLGCLSPSSNPTPIKKEKKLIKKRGRPVKRKPVKKKQETPTVGDEEVHVDLTEEYLEDFSSDDEVLESVKPPVTEPVQNASKEISIDNPKLLSLPEL